MKSNYWTTLYQIQQYQSVNNVTVGNVGCLGNMWMVVKRWLRAADELWKLIEIVEYLSGFEHETLSTGVQAVTYLLICLLGYSIRER